MVLLFLIMLLPFFLQGSWKISAIKLVLYHDRLCINDLFLDSFYFCITSFINALTKILDQKGRGGCTSAKYQTLEVKTRLEQMPASDNHCCLASALLRFKFCAAVLLCQGLTLQQKKQIQGSQYRNLKTINELEFSKRG